DGRIFVLRGGSANRNVGLNSGAADGLAARRVPLGSRQTDTHVGSGQREDALDRALPVALFADDCAAAVIAYGAGQDLAGAGRIVIDQQDQWHPPGSRRLAPMIKIFPRAATPS